MACRAMPSASAPKLPVAAPRCSCYSSVSANPERPVMSTDSSGEFHRIRRLPPYVFAEVNTAKAKARGAGEDIIDLGMGNPDSPTPPHIVATLVETVQD